MRGAEVVSLRTTCYLQLAAPAAGAKGDQTPSLHPVTKTIAALSSADRSRLIDRIREDYRPALQCRICGSRQRDQGHVSELKLVVGVRLLALLNAPVTLQEMQKCGKGRAADFL